ncbi:MAG TPA: hypothetical protein VL172_08750 [Kofleriaceae bacterium]|jgi:hypothetical protein|nr:hypothetical protein [Kofleriaceae bacterium]
MRDHRLHAALIVATLGVAAPARAAESPRRIGIVVSTAVNVTADQARALADSMGQALTDELGVEVIAGAETERRLPAGGLAEECVAKPECRSDLGRRLDADELLFLVVIKVGDEIQIDPTWTDVATARVTSRAAIKIGKGADAGAIFRKQAHALLPHIRKDKGPNIVVVNAGQGDSGRHMTTPAWIALGVTGAALAGGALFGLQARGRFNDLDGVCGTGSLPPCEQSDIDSLRHRALAADVCFGVGAAAAITTFVLYLRSDRGAPEAPPITVQPTTAGLTLDVGGRF